MSLKKKKCPAGTGPRGSRLDLYPETHPSTEKLLFATDSNHYFEKKNISDQNTEIKESCGTQPQLISL